MNNGIYLTLMVGPAVPVPVSKDVLDALDSIEVISKSSGASGFQLTFNMSTSSALHTVFLFSGGAVIPLIRVVIAVTFNGNTEVLIDGVITKQEIVPGSDPSRTSLVITGEDLTRIMDYLDLSGIPYPAMPFEASIALILAKYAAFGVLPLVVPSIMIDIPIPVVQILRQQGTDLQYIKMLARSVGYIFCIEPGPMPGMSVAYWGPEIKVGIPQPAINVNMDAHTNVESISFSYDSEKATLPILYTYNEVTKIVLLIPLILKDITPLSPPLGLIPPIPKKTKMISVSNLSPLRAVLYGMAKASRTADVITARGTLDVIRYGHVLRPRRLVGVRGAGTAFNGLYYVSSVTHNIKRGEYKQSFTLTRNGLISTLQEVPV
jgi:hypothetical protein